jgi:hypothetical protein
MLLPVYVLTVVAQKKAELGLFKGFTKQAVEVVALRMEMLGL